MDSKLITGRKDVVLTLAIGEREFTARVRVPQHPRKGILALKRFILAHHRGARVIKVEDVVPGGQTSAE